MGDRVSVSFVNEGRESVTLFCHWGGKGFVTEAVAYLKDLHRELEKRDHNGDPIGRLDPETVMVDFIRHMTKDIKMVTSDLYLGKDQSDGDNSDNGHWALNVKDACVEI